MERSVVFYRDKLGFKFVSSIETSWVAATESGFALANEADGKWANWSNMANLRMIDLTLTSDRAARWEMNMVWDARIADEAARRRATGEANLATPEYHAKSSSWQPTPS